MENDCPDIYTEFYEAYEDDNVTIYRCPSGDVVFNEHNCPDSVFTSHSLFTSRLSVLLVSTSVLMAPVSPLTKSVPPCKNVLRALYVLHNNAPIRRSGALVAVVLPPCSSVVPILPAPSILMTISHSRRPFLDWIWPVMITTQSFLSSHYVQRRSPFAVQTTSVFKTALCVPHRRSVLNRRLSCVKTEGISIFLHSSLSSCVISVQQCRKSTIEKCPPDYFKCSSMTCAPTKELCPNTMVTTSPFSL